MYGVYELHDDLQMYVGPIYECESVAEAYAYKRLRDLTCSHQMSWVHNMSDSGDEFSNVELPLKERPNMIAAFRKICGILCDENEKRNDLEIKEIRRAEEKKTKERRKKAARSAPKEPMTYTIGSMFPEIFF